MHQPDDFSEVLRTFMAHTRRSDSDLSHLTGIPARTIEKWRSGVVRRPRQATDVIKLARALNLDAEATTTLLTRAGHLPLETIRQKAQATKDAASLALLSSWPAVAPRAAPHPAPATLVPTNLPRPLAALIGRERDIALLIARMQQPHLRLITLTGPPGVGKTRLGMHVAAELVGHYPDGVWFVDLASIHDPNMLLVTIAGALGVQGDDHVPLLTKIGVALHAQRVLLLLDNCEQISGAGPAIAALLGATPGLTVLSTSRTLLHVVGEQCWEVFPLPLPALEQPPASIAATPSVALFVERAQALLPSFTLTSENAPTIAAICRQLEGLPLALELAAARLQLFSPSALLAHLDQRLDVLAGQRLVGISRYRSVRAALAWSYELLDPPMQRLLRWCGVLCGGGSLAAVAAICAEERRSRLVWDGMTELLNQHLVERREDPAGEARFVLLEMIRDYAVEQMIAYGELAHVQQRHASYYLALAEEAEGGLRGLDHPAWFIRLRQERANLRAALAWAASSGAIDIVVRLVFALQWFWRMTGTWSDEYALAAAAITAASSDDTLAPSLRARGTYVVGIAFRQAGDTLQARSSLEASLTHWQALGDRRRMMHVLGDLAHMARMQGDYSDAHALYMAQLTHARALNDTMGRADVLGPLGWMAATQGDGAAALAHFTECLAICQTHQDYYGCAQANLGLGWLALGRGELTQAQAHADSSLHLAETYSLDDVVGRAHILQGIIALLRHETTQARRLFTDELRRAADTGEIELCALAVEGLAGLAGQQGQAQQAAHFYGAASAWRAAEHLRRQPEYASWYAQMLATARAHADDQVWARSWAAGAARTLTQVLAQLSEAP